MIFSLSCLYFEGLVRFLRDNTRTDKGKTSFRKSVAFFEAMSFINPVAEMLIDGSTKLWFITLHTLLVFWFSRTLFTCVTGTSVPFGRPEYLSASAATVDAIVAHARGQVWLSSKTFRVGSDWLEVDVCL